MATYDPEVLQKLLDSLNYEMMWHNQARHDTTVLEQLIFLETLAKNVQKKKKDIFLTLSKIREKPVQFYLEKNSHTMSKMQLKRIDRDLPFTTLARFHYLSRAMNYKPMHVFNISNRRRARYKTRITTEEVDMIVHFIKATMKDMFANITLENNIIIPTPLPQTNQNQLTGVGIGGRDGQ